MIFTLVWSILGLGCGTGEPAIEGEFVQSELLVQFDDTLSSAERKQVLKEYGFTEVARLDRIGVSHLDLGGEGVAVALRRMRRDHRLSFAEPNYVAHAVGAPNDPYFSEQWNLDRVGALEAWSTTRGQGTIVAVLDTGVEPGGTDGIHGLLEGRDFIYGREMYDTYGHGTHVAGTVAQNTDNGKGAAGLAPGASVLPVKVLGDNGSGRGLESRMQDGAEIVGAKGFLTDGGTHVPLIANWPGTIPAGQLREELVGPTDFLATLAEATGTTPLDPPGDGLLDSVSFLPQLKGKTGTPRDWLLIEYFEDRDIFRNCEGRFVRNRRWKLYAEGVSPFHETPFFKAGQLYDLQSDPNEENPIPAIEDGSEAAAVRKRFLAVLDRHRKHAAARTAR